MSFPIPAGVQVMSFDLSKNMDGKANVLVTAVVYDIASN